MFVAAEIAVVGGSPDGPAAVIYGFPALWTFPLLLRRRWPSFSVLVVLGALALESRLAQEATESIAVLPPVMLAFWVAGTIEDRARSTAIGVAGAVLGLVIVAANPGPLHVADVVFLAVFMGAPFAAGATLRSREEHAADLERRAAALERERDERDRAVVAEERARIARELHDIVGHSIGVMMAQTGAARFLVDDEPDRAREALLVVEDAGRQALIEMRRMLAILRDDEASDVLGPQPGLGDLRELVASSRASGLDVELTMEGDSAPSSVGVELAAYRIVQEALTNARRHGGKTHASVLVRRSPGALELTVVNDGAVAGSADGEQGGGHGVIGMRERVALYGGRLEVGPRTGGGYVVHARLPYEGPSP
jgi:signal transduction histidine kinase